MKKDCLWYASSGIILSIICELLNKDCQWYASSWINIVNDMLVFEESCWCASNLINIVNDIRVVAERLLVSMFASSSIERW